MFGKLPDLLGRNFAIGYFLPVITYLSITFWFLGKVESLPEEFTLPQEQQPEILTGTAVTIFIAWLGGILLMAMNREIIRFLEGYGSFNPLQLLKPIQTWRFKKLNKEIEALTAKNTTLREKGESLPVKEKNKRAALMKKRVVRYPDDERWLLSTTFGNTMRAFEVYPRNMYGIDAIPWWNRLLAIIPKDYFTLMDNAKTQVDLWINFLVLSTFTCALSASLIVIKSQTSLWWFPIINLIVAWIAYRRAASAAVGWGDYVKSAFDMFLPKLYTTLGFSRPLTLEGEKEFWQRLSQAVIYHSASSMEDNINKYRKKLS